MRLFTNYKVSRKRRRGMSFVEVVASLFVITMICSIVLGMSIIIKHSMASTVGYIDLKMYATDTIEKIRSDLENGIEIDTVDYNDYSSSSTVTADVQIDYIEDVYGKPLYKVELQLVDKKSRERTTIKTLLRPGCSVS